MVLGLRSFLAVVVFKDEVSSPLCRFAVAQDLGILLSHIVSCREDASLQSAFDPMGKDDRRRKEKSDAWRRVRWLRYRPGLT